MCGRRKAKITNNGRIKAICNYKEKPEVYMKKKKIKLIISPCAKKTKRSLAKQKTKK